MWLSIDGPGFARSGRSGTGNNCVGRGQRGGLGNIEWRRFATCSWELIELLPRRNRIAVHSAAIAFEHIDIGMRQPTTLGVHFLGSFQRRVRIPRRAGITCGPASGIVLGQDPSYCRQRGLRTGRFQQSGPPTESFCVVVRQRHERRRCA